MTSALKSPYTSEADYLAAELLNQEKSEYAGGQVVHSIARWDGTQWHPMGQGFNESVYVQNCNSCYCYNIE